MQQRIELVNGKFVVKEGKKEAITPPEEKPIVKQYSEEVIVLRDRVIKANQKLFDAWIQIRDITDRDEKENQLNRWNKAQDKLHHLCLELQSKGYEDCLYIKYYEGLTEEEEKVVMEEIFEGKVIEVPGGIKTKNCFDNPDGFWCQVCPSKYPYWQEDARNLPYIGDKKEGQEG